VSIAEVVGISRNTVRKDKADPDRCPLPNRQKGETRLITLTEHNSGYTLARNGEPLARFTAGEVNELKGQLTDFPALDGGHATTTPVKARLTRWVKPPHRLA
jgi:hypothetical protein